MTTSEYSTEEEEKCAEDSQNNDFISLSRFELLKWLIKRFWSPLLLYFYYFIMSMWPWISLESYSCWRWSLSTSSSQCHNNPVLVPPRKPPDHVKDLYDGQTYDLKTRVDIWTRMDVVPVDYWTFTQTFHLTMWFFRFINGIAFKWYYVMWRIIALLVWIGLWIKLRIYLVPSDPVRWYCRGFGFIWRAFMLNWMLWTNNYFKVSHRKQFNAPSNMKLVKSVMNFECHPCGMFEVLPYHQ